MNRSTPTLNPRRWVYAALGSLLAIAAVFYFLTRDAQDGEAKAEQIVATFADQAAQACSDPAQRVELARQGFSCKAIEDAAEQVKAGGDPVLVPGPQGERGVTGPRGFTGSAGVDGEPGPRGATGPAGKAGEPGLPGPTGPIGPNGQPGGRGDDGQDGAAGSAGKDGQDGVPGERGPQGEKGDPGRDGVDGAPGVPGDVGPAGPAGPAGAQGVPGVVNVVTSPECADLKPKPAISLAYDALTQTLTLVCA